MPPASRHSLRRDARSIGHHYDVERGFYEIVLGPAMTYSCGRFVDDRATLLEAQEAKHELICRKLGLHERGGARLLDVGCGWGSLALHAAAHHDARVVGITISAEQATAAAERVSAAGLDDRVEIRLQDYRTLAGISLMARVGGLAALGKPPGRAPTLAHRATPVVGTKRGHPSLGKGRAAGKRSAPA